MIEQEMVFALGFLTAGLLSLSCLPAVWRRAIRLTARRLSQRLPLSMDEIVAERDGMRAGFAVEQRRLEQRLEAAEGRHRDLMVHLGRRDVTVAALEDAAAVAESRIAALTRDLNDTTQDLRGVRAEAGTAAVALRDLTGLAERRLWEVLAAEEEAAKRQSIVDNHRATIASLETRILGLDMRVADLTRVLDETRAELARAVQATPQASAERDAALTAGQVLRAERDGLARDVGRLMGIAEASRQDAASLRQALSAREATIDDLRVQGTNLEAQLAMRAEAAQALADQLRIEKAQAAAWRETRPELETSGPQAEDAALAVLRETLRQVADDVLRWTERGVQAAPDPGPALLAERIVDTSVPR